MTTMPALHRIRPGLLLPLAVAVGSLAFAFSCLFYAPEGTPWNLGLAYQGMSTDPLGARGPFPHRVLAPLLAYLLGLGGERYWLFHHATVIGFLAVVFGAAILRGCSVLGGVVLALTISVTGAVELYKGHVGYPEPITFSLMITSVLVARRTGWFWLVQFLGLLTHDSLLFFWPWMLYVRANANGRLRRVDLIAVGVVLAAYALARWFLMGSRAGTYSLAFYLSDQTTSYALGMWALDVLALLVNFGVLPVLLAWHAWFDGWRRAGVTSCLIVLAIFGMSFVAADLMRFTCYLVVPLVFAGIRLVQQPRGVLVLAGLAVLAKLTMFAQHGPAALVFETMGKHLPDPVSAVVPKVVPELWYVWGGYLLAYAIMLWAGRWYARRWPNVDPVIAAEPSR